MAKIRIRNIPYDGEYELSGERGINAREWRWIKTLSGYMPLTIAEGFAGGDPDLYVAFGVVALCRAGKIDRDDMTEVADVLAEAPFGSIQVIDEEADESPLALTSEPGEPSQSGSLEKTTWPGEPSPTDSATSDKTPETTGASSSETSSTSALTVLAS